MATTFMAGPSSQEGIDMASAMLQQRLAALQQGPQMDLLFRRDPRAATALIQSQMASRDAEADRMQRGDLAGQEMDYRNRSLDMQGQMAGDERQAQMQRLLAQLAGQRGMMGERMGFEGQMEQQRQAAAALEAERNRTLQSQLAQSQQQFQAGEGRLGREHQSGLAKDQMTLSREQMMNEVLAKLMDQQTRRDASKDDLRGRLLGALAERAVTTDSAGWAEIQRRIPQVMGQIGGGGQAAAAPAPQPLTAEGKFAAKYPELMASWDKAIKQKDGATNKPVADFVLGIPEEDVSSNKEAFKDYLGLRYGNKPLDDLLVSGFDAISEDRPARINRLRKMYGLSPNQTTALRTWATGPFPMLFDAVFGTPQ